MMMKLSQVSRTAILTLIARVVASEKKNSIYNDPMAALCLERLMSMASEEEKRWIIREKRIYGGIQASHLCSPGALSPDPRYLVITYIYHNEAVRRPTPAKADVNDATEAMCMVEP